MTTHAFRHGAVCAALAALGCLTGCMPPAAVTYASRSATADSLARQAIQSEQSLNAANIPQNTVSVAPLAVLSADTTYSTLGFGVASLLVSDLSKSAKLTMVERLRIDAVLRELQLAESGRVDTATAPRIGRLVGARQIVVGAVDLRARNTIQVQSYVANTVTGRVGSSLNGSGTLAQIFDAEKALAFRLFDVLGVTLTPAERRAVEQKPTNSLVAFLSFSRASRAEAFGNYANAVALYADAVRLDPSFALAKQRLDDMQNTVVPLAPVNTAVQLSRASAITTDLINRPLPVTIGTGVDVPVTGRTQTVTITVIIRTP
jgi:curli biogenesis system outer membrane secretion channel CsgG